MLESWINKLYKEKSMKYEAILKCNCFQSLVDENIKMKSLQKSNNFVTTTY